MTKPTRDQLKDLLRESHQRDRRDPAERAKGLDALLAATQAPAPIPPPPSGGKKLVAGVAIAVSAVGLAVWWMKPTPDKVPEVVVDAGVVQVVVPPPVVDVVGSDEASRELLGVRTAAQLQQHLDPNERGLGAHRAPRKLPLVRHERRER